MNISKFIDSGGNIEMARKGLGNGLDSMLGVNTTAERKKEHLLQMTKFK